MSSPYRYVARTTNPFIGMATSELGGQTYKSRLCPWPKNCGMRARCMPPTKRDVRMSTDRQQHSIQNQAAVIAAYAYAHNFTLVRTYKDEGESGFRT
jgi:resolvase-like protein